MLQTIRELTQGWIAGVIVTIIIMTFALWGIHSYFIGGANVSEVATVNGVEISKQQLGVAYERIRRQTLAQYGSTSPILPKDETVLKSQALQALVTMEVLRQASIAQGFRVSNIQVDRFLQSMPEFQVNGQFSVERLQEVLASNLLSIAEFLDLIKTDLLIEQPKLGIIFTSFALPNETQSIVEIMNQERAIEYLNLPLNYFLAKQIVISPNQIQAYYTSHKNEFMTPEQVKVDYIELSITDLMKKINPTEQELKNIYNENLNTYTQPMLWKIADILIPSTNNSPAEVAKAKNTAELAYKMLKQGENFDAVASRYSSKNLFSQGLIPLSQVPDELKKSVSGLVQPNQVSGIIRTHEGFVILKIIEVKRPEVLPFTNVQEKIRQNYIRQQAEEKLVDLREKLADFTYEHPDSLDYAAKMLDLPIKTSEFFTKDQPGKDISQYKKVRNAAFVNDVLNLRNNSDVIQLTPQNFIVLHIKDHLSSSMVPIANVAKQIENKLKTQEAEGLAKKFADDFKVKLQNGANPEQLASINHLTWIKTGYIGRNDTKVDSAILDMAFRLPHPDSVKQPVYGVARLADGYAVVAIKSVKKGSVDKNQMSIFNEQVQNSEGVLEYELYKQSQIHRAKIKYNT